LILFSNCKINLGLHILDKRPDGYHNLETVFYPAKWFDALEIIQNDPLKNDEFNLQASGINLPINKQENHCYKAYYLLKKDFPHLPSITLHLHKTIPFGAGLGGGSANAAFTLLLLNKKFRLGLNSNQLEKYALAIGSDCPFFIKNIPCLATGRGEVFFPITLALSQYKIVIINPQIHIATGWAFSQLKKRETRVSIAQAIEQPIETWKENLTNDFEEPIFEAHPEIKNIKDQLYQSGALYASLSGSGSSVFGIFNSEVQPSLNLPQQYLMKEC